MKTNLLLLILLFALSSCNTKKAQQSAADDCKHTGMVKDYSTLDGCGFIILSDSGEKLYVAKGLEGQKLQDQQLIKFNYKPMEDMMTICMVESKVVEITCFEVFGKAKEDPLPKKCAPVSSPMNSKWMNTLESKLHPVQIDRYDYEDGYGYHFICKRDEFFFDCDGNKICEGCEESVQAGGKSCEMIKDLKGKYTIWVINQ